MGLGAQVLSLGAADDELPRRDRGLLDAYVARGIHDCPTHVQLSQVVNTCLATLMADIALGQPA